MNITQLADKVAKSHKLSKTAARAVITDTLDTIKGEVKKGHQVRLVGFGTFTKAARKARIGRNPQTGEQIKIPATKFPKFKAGAEFKTLLK